MARITANKAIEAVKIELEATQLEVNKTSVSVAPSALTYPVAQASHSVVDPSVVVHHSSTSQSPAVQAKAAQVLSPPLPSSVFGVGLNSPVGQSSQAGLLASVVISQY
jgi:hypothetical protein